MFAEIKKALSVTHHPGISKRVSLPILVRNALPYFLSFQGKAKPPLSIYWSVNSVCNLKCKMCDVGMAVEESNFFKNLRLNGERDEIEIDVFRRVVDEVAADKPMISITSTEPLIYRPLPEAIEHARKKGLEVTVTTGAYNLASRAPDLIEAGLQSINVSLDGPPALHNEIRGRRDSFERAIEGIRRMKELAALKPNHPMRVLVNCTITNHNYFAVADMVEILRKEPIDNINITFMNFVDQDTANTHNAVWGEKYNATVNCLAGGTDPFAVDLAVLGRQLDIIRTKHADRATILPDLSAAQLLRYFRKPGEFISGTRCMVSWFIAQIIANGDVIPYTRCYNVPLGNVRTQSFKEIWNGQAMLAWRKDLRHEHRFPACTRCDQCH
jgi:MoaA/NifB/PqqE/SkfB family radical SAM enzyme